MMTTTVSFAVQLVDFITGKMVTKDVLVSGYNGFIRPVRNLEGQFVFVNLDVQALDITVSSKKYEQVHFEITLPTAALIKIILIPKPAFVVSGVDFNLKPFERVLIGSRTKLFNLTADVSVDSSKISIYAPHDYNLTRLPYVFYGNNGLGEQVFFTRRIKAGVYELRNGTCESYKRREFKLCPLMPLQAGEDGLLRVPLERMGVTYEKDDIFLL